MDPGDRGAAPSRPDPAPLNPGALEAALRPFGHSRMLPRAAYVDPEVFAWERRHFFDGGWTCVGRSEDVAEAGDQRAESTGGAGVLLTRAGDGVLRAFANVCSHRGHELLPCGVSAQHGRVICPYHSWSYTLEGDVWTAPGFADVEGFDRTEHGLTELPAVEWHGLVFVDGSGAAAPLEEGLATLEDIVAPYEPERLRVAGRHEYVVAANWKILIENYHECFHCRMIHPQFCQVSPPSSGVNFHREGTWVGGPMKLREGVETMSLDGRSGGVMLRGLDDEARRTVLYLNIFPNILLSLHPDYVMTHRLTPLAVDSTRIDCTWAFAPEALARPDFDPSYAMNLWDITNQQDWDACASVQRGLSSVHARPGPMAGAEDAVYQFVTMVAAGYRGRPVRHSGAPLSTT
jgi:glycine betaine catabolism A